jgi:hypothetical protein
LIHPPTNWDALQTSLSCSNGEAQPSDEKRLNFDSLPKAPLPIQPTSSLCAVFKITEGLFHSMTIAVKYQGHPADSNASSWQRKDAYRMDISAPLRSEAHFSIGERLVQ